MAPGQARWAAGAGALLRGAGAYWPPPGSPPSAASLGTALALTSAPGLLSFFFFLSRKLLLLLLPCSQGRQGHPLLWGGKRPSRTPLRPSLRAVGAEWPRSVLPAA